MLRSRLKRLLGQLRGIGVGREANDLNLFG